MNMWLDGICKKCGFFVIEQSASHIPAEECDYADYMNGCLNVKCEEHKWHYVGDQEELDYYDHDPKIADKMKIVLKNDEQILNQLNDIVEGK